MNYAAFLLSDFMAAVGTGFYAAGAEGAFAFGKKQNRLSGSAFRIMTPDAA